MQDKILPIGSVVSLQDGDGTPLVIVSRAALYKKPGDSEISGYFDYCAVVHPQGLQDPNDMLFFNHENIDEVYTLGYRDNEELAFEDNYAELVESSGYPKLSVDND
ncbi:DUF4176 domain-containing protein [Bombilactobacillus thymidiniphilus]|uniref:DUF4176 domain-containing protein n=1 Tax=Bombilactobacillus thymidiniphilus TaxID=2923363 RepID=A0ABY4PBB4_9LACO|nr:DUF4176 domain-containing protein [Bombilactobacillus thymidiniphilus]UQS83053.1 DUF4176 domain-containing protein [Bombilactobacillus thymidiniphilus]